MARIGNHGAPPPSYNAALNYPVCNLPDQHIPSGVRPAGSRPMGGRVISQRPTIYVRLPSSANQAEGARGTEGAKKVGRTKFFDLNVASCLPVLGAAFALFAALMHLVMAAGHAVAGNQDKAKSELKWAGFRGCDILTNLGLTVGFLIVIGFALLSPQRKQVTVTTTDIWTGATRIETMSGYGTTTYV